MKYLAVLFFILGSINAAYAINCPEGHFPVRSHPRNAYTKTDGTSVSATQVKEQCRLYRRLTKPEPFFTTQTPKNWPNPKEKFKSWTKKEEIKIRSILEKLPKSITNIGNITFLRSTEKSPNPSVSNSENQIIVIYDSVSSHDLSRVISHELAHIYWDSIDTSLQENFQTAAEWKISKDNKTISLQRKNVKIQDSYLGPHEDFSNLIELFIQNKDSFKDQPILHKCLENFLK
jgi:hypothetical protein